MAKQRNIHIIYFLALNRIEAQPTNVYLEPHAQNWHNLISNVGFTIFGKHLPFSSFQIDKNRGDWKPRENKLWIRFEAEARWCHYFWGDIRMPGKNTDIYFGYLISLATARNSTFHFLNVSPQFFLGFKLNRNQTHCTIYYTQKVLFECVFIIIIMLLVFISWLLAYI